MFVGEHQEGLEWESGTCGAGRRSQDLGMGTSRTEGQYQYSGDP